MENAGSPSRISTPWASTPTRANCAVTLLSRSDRRMLTSSLVSMIGDSGISGNGFMTLTSRIASGSEANSRPTSSAASDCASPSVATMTGDVRLARMPTSGEMGVVATLVMRSPGRQMNGCSQGHLAALLTPSANARDLVRRTATVRRRLRPPPGDEARGQSGVLGPDKENCVWAILDHPVAHGTHQESRRPAAVCRHDDEIRGVRTTTLDDRGSGLTRQRDFARDIEMSTAGIRSIDDALEVLVRPIAPGLRGCFDGRHRVEGKGPDDRRHHWLHDANEVQ